MQKKAEGLDLLLKRVSIDLNKSPEDLEPFFVILKNNWYESEEDLCKLTVGDFERMKIPHRVASSIIQQLGSKSKTSANKQNNESKPNSQKIVLTEQTMTDLVRDFAVKLQQKLNANGQEMRSIIQILYKIIANIVKDPFDMKFRVLKKSNSLIQRNIVQHQPCLQLMKAIGFEDCGQTLQMSKFEVPHLIFIEECLNFTMENLSPDKYNGYKKMPQMPKKQENMFLDVKKFPTNQNEVKEQFSEQKLSEMKYVDALDKLLEIRNKMMSQPLKERQMKIYHKRLESKAVNVGEICFEQQFSKSTDADVVGYWKQIMASNAKSQKFQSKRKLQFQYLIKQKIYKETLIKVKLPNQLIIEAYFGPMEKLSEVLKLVQTIVYGDIYLFTAPPKKIMDKKELDKTLIELDSVPQGSFYLSANNDYFYIKNEYVPFIQK